LLVNQPSSCDFPGRSTSSLPPPLPALYYLNRFVYSGAGDSALVNVDGFLSAQTVALHTLVIRHSQRYPTSFLPAGNLRNLYLTLSISTADFLSQLLTHGQQLETFRLEVDLEHGCVLSTVFRSYAKPNSFPTLQKLSFILMGAPHNFSDPDLFPAIAEFVRGYGTLNALCISNTFDLPGFGYDASIWGVLPSLVNLRTLLIDVPKDMPPALLAWLIPRGVTVLDLQVARQATVDLNVRGIIFLHIEKHLDVIASSNYGRDCRTLSSSSRCPSAHQRFKIPFGVASRPSASCDSGLATYIPFMGGAAKENWDTGLIGGRDFILMIVWTSWTVGNYVFSIQGSRGLGRLLNVQYIELFFLCYVSFFLAAELASHLGTYSTVPMAFKYLAHTSMLCHAIISLVRIPDIVWLKYCWSDSTRRDAWFPGRMFVSDCVFASTPIVPNPSSVCVRYVRT